MKVFIAGPRAISRLDKAILERLRSICDKNCTVLVGDANGIDKAVQKFFFEAGYANVCVFVSGNTVRNNLGGWQVENVEVDKKLKGFAFYAQKDLAMATTADYGFMIWNGESKGTLNNIINLIGGGKKVLVYLTPAKQFVSVGCKDELATLIAGCSAEARQLYNELTAKEVQTETQTSLFSRSSEPSAETQAFLHSANTAE